MLAEVAAKLSPVNCVRLDDDEALETVKIASAQPLLRPDDYCYPCSSIFLRLAYEWNSYSEAARILYPTVTIVFPDMPLYSWEFVRRDAVRQQYCLYNLLGP
jgi:hypothetical protein